MMNKKKIVWIIASILMVTFGAIGVYFLRFNKPFLQIRLQFITSPVPALITLQTNSQKLCENALSLLEYNDDFMLPKNDMVASAQTVHGCIARSIVVYETPSQAEQAFAHFTRHISELDAWNSFSLNGRTDASIATSDFDWELTVPMIFKFQGISKIYFVIIKQCNAIAVIKILVSKDGISFSPGVKVSQKELVKYANQIYRRMRWQFCSN